MVSKDKLKVPENPEGVILQGADGPKEFRHVPVMPEECISNLMIEPDGVYVDGTLGGGGHSQLICGGLSEKGLLIGIDQDSDALEAAGKRLEEYNCRKIFVKDNYSNIKEILERPEVLKELEVRNLSLNRETTNGQEKPKINGALLDLGVSSFQLDTPERGFSYMNDAPLDMRMDQEGAFTAYDVVNTYSEKELAEIIKKYGEERWASRIASFIAKERKKEAISTTSKLVEIIKSAVPARARRDGPHPAKRTFQAIRIEVNDELGQLEKAVDEFMDVLAPGGRLCIITFHSLEDRIVKEAFTRRLNPCTCPPEFPVCVCGKVPDVKKVTGKPIVPGTEELENNPRSRSAKLRVIEKER